MGLLAVFNNPVLVASLIAWAIAQTGKLPFEYARTRRWNWSLLLRAGGMPSSHSASVTAVAHGIGLTEGFDSPLFALAMIFAIVVVYDAAGIRRQAGRHAEIINAIVRDTMEGHPLRRQRRLRVVLGHSPVEALVGMLLGLGVAQIVVSAWGS
jgi:acid phosphatase family membrane protein YuiD